MNSALSRRSFLQHSAAASAALALAGCSTAPTVSAPAAPARIIDPHTHYYDPSRPGGVPWPPKNDALLYRTVRPADYRALPVPQKVDGTVVVEASALVEDNPWILDLAANDPFIVGFVGNLPVGTEPFDGYLARFVHNKLFRGLRISGKALEKGLTNRDFLDDLHEIADHDLSLDLVHLADTLDEVPKLARTVPNLRIVVDHVANVNINGKTPPEDWRDQVHALAEHRNVFMKVSGLVEGSGRKNGDAPADVDFYRPVLDTVWTALGPDRLIYASNWPVSERFAPLSRVEEIALGYFRAKGQGTMDKVFWKNSHTAYKWVKR
ncbi:MAG: amidohydrolase family protein [Verrucomicrobia bacterium]|nr:amidohydrolase family protein [Verrucomicrobiota bacterium]